MKARMEYYFTMGRDDMLSVVAQQDGFDIFCLSAGLTITVSRDQLVELAKDIEKVLGGES